MKRSLSKKAKKVIEENLEEFKAMPQARNAGGPFHSLILPPRVTQMDEIQEIIPLL